MPRFTQNHGELLIDHRASPGISKAAAEKLRVMGHVVPIIGEGKTETIKTKSCAHCGGVTALNPGRIRERGHCYKCDKYVCDGCAAIGDCRPIQALADAIIGTDKPLDNFSQLLTRSK